MSNIQYDIQGQITTKDKVTALQDVNDYIKGNSPDDRLGRYAAFVDNPAGGGSNLIPATSPGLEDPHVPGQPMSDAQKTNLAPQGHVAQDPWNSAIDANAAGLKSMGVVTESQADVDASQLGVGVLGTAPSGL